MSSYQRSKPWKKGSFSKKLTKPYQANAEDKSYMDEILLHSDKSILAFNKPSGLACQTRNPDDRTFDKLLAVYAKSNGKTPRLVHRLDAQTSGMIVTARTKPAAAYISEAFANRYARKTYIAIVEGADFEDTKGQINIPLKRYQKLPNLALMRAARPSEKDVAQQAVTDYEVLDSHDGLHCLRLAPQTGRMHQLRAHLCEIGRPIIGDPYYNENAPRSAWNKPRLMLHALRLNIPHPDSGEFDMAAPLHDDMVAFMRNVGLDKGLLAIERISG
jgi:RluA family pseudouridine synthase